MDRFCDKLAMHSDVEVEFTDANGVVDEKRVYRPREKNSKAVNAKPLMHQDAVPLPKHLFPLRSIVAADNAALNQKIDLTAPLSAPRYEGAMLSQYRTVVAELCKVFPPKTRIIWCGGYYVKVQEGISYTIFGKNTSGMKLVKNEEGKTILIRAVTSPYTPKLSPAVLELDVPRLLVDDGYLKTVQDWIVDPRKKPQGNWCTSETMADPEVQARLLLSTVFVEGGGSAAKKQCLDVPPLVSKCAD